MRFIDTNIFVRYLTGDDAAKAQACAALFERLESGEDESMTTAVVIAEVFYVLTGKTYRRSRTEVAISLKPLLAFRGWRLDDRQLILHALDVCEAFPNLDFEDALIIARMQAGSIEELYSYDRGFDRVPGITRLEPASA